MPFISFIAVFIIIYNLTIKLSFASGYKWWLGFLFLNALILAYMFENTIKPKIVEKAPAKRIIIEILVRYFLPYSLAFTFARLLIVNGYIKH